MTSPTVDGIGQHSWIAQRYRIGSELARGGMGTVSKVLDEETGEPRALKRLLQPSTPDMRALFEREYRTLAGIRHPRIIEVFDYGIDRGEPYYTMELLDGQDLRDLAPLPFSEACRHLRDVATSLALLHTRRLLHRDIKAGNVRLTRDGGCKLLDFGALTPFGVPDRVVGTAPYLPPEALRRAPLDQRADLYAFGALCYWLLTRRHAYRARDFAELPELWRKRPTPPSKLQPDIPRSVDHLILGLLDPDPMARPNSMAEVVEILNTLGDLPPEDEETQHALGESYLATTQFVGRTAELKALGACVHGLRDGQGGTFIVEGPGGVGRTRLLDELDAQSRMAGVMTIHVDAAMHDRPRGTALAAIIQLIEKSDAARREAERYRQLLRHLDPHLQRLLGVVEPGHGAEPVQLQVREVLFGLLGAAVEQAPLLILVDNADEADEASLGLFAAAPHLGKERPLGLVLAGRPVDREAGQWASLHGSATAVPIEPFTAEQTHELSRSIFGAAPNLVRFSQWLHQRSGGLPLHCVEMIRRLHEDGVIRFREGLWILPSEPPQEAATEALGPLIDRHLDSLSEEAYAFAEAIAVRRGVVARSEGLRTASIGGEAAFGVVDELLRRNVLAETVDGYSFRNNALRESIRRRMADARKRDLHLRCAEQVLEEVPKSASAMSHAARIEAGWHLLHAGEEDRGADLLAAVAYDTIGVRLAFADLQVVAPALEAALEIYTRQGRSLLERAPLLAALAQAGYYEHRRWADKYGEAAISACEEVTGLKTARRMQRFLGKTLGLLFGLGAGWFRYIRTPRRARRCSFRDLIVQLMGLVTTLTGVAACALDVEQARRMASVLDPFRHLPERLTPVGIGQFCRSLSEIGRDNPAEALRTWTLLLERFDDRSYYPTLPPEARPLYIGGLWFARGVFECFRDGEGALRAADALDGLGMKMYRLIASELRMLHYACRAQHALSQQHGERVEMHAVEMGSASQVELWEPAALILPNTMTGDVVGLRQVTQRLLHHGQSIPSLGLFAELARLALEHAIHDRTALQAMDVDSPESLLRVQEAAWELFFDSEPRAFIGWGTLAGYMSRNLNRLGDHARARKACEHVVGATSDEDRQFVALFLGAELELAVAEAGEGDATAACDRLDALLARHAQGNNPLTRGRIHDAYCRVAAIAGHWQLFHHHLAATKAYYRATESTTLAARAELLASLVRPSQNPPGPDSIRAPDASEGRTRTELEPTADLDQEPDTRALRRHRGEPTAEAD